MTPAPFYHSTLPVDTQPSKPPAPLEDDNLGDTQPPADPDHLPLDEDNHDHADLDKFMA